MLRDLPNTFLGALAIETKLDVMLFAFRAREVARPANAANKYSVRATATIVLSTLTFFEFEYRTPNQQWRLFFSKGSSFLVWVSSFTPPEEAERSDVRASK